MSAASRTAARPRRGRPGYDLDGLLSVVVEVFNERGFDGTSMEDLSRRLGIAKSAIYHHVASKDELLELALRPALDGLEAVAADVNDRRVPAGQRLELLVGGSVEVLRRELPAVTLLLRVRGNSAVERAALDRRRRFDRAVAELVREAQRDGDVAADLDPRTAAHLVFGLVNSLVEWYHPGRDAPDIAATVTRFALAGLRASPAHST